MNQPVENTPVRPESEPPGTAFGQDTDATTERLLERYRSVLASALDPLITIDAHGRIQAASESVHRIFGHHHDELIGQNVSILIPEPHRSRHDDYLRSYRDTNETSILGRSREFDALHKDGHTVPISLSVSRTEAPGHEHPLFTAVIHDLSERKRAEHELLRHRDELRDLVSERDSELQASRQSLRQADRLAAIGTLAAGIGHDMGNIVLPIRCHLDALAAMDLPADALEQLAVIRKWIDYLAELGGGLRLLAQDPERTAPSDESAKVDLATWWAQTGPLLANGLPKGVTLHDDIEPGLPPVAVSLNRLTQAGLNLVVNAGEAISSGPTGTGRVTILARRLDRSRVRLAVADDGPGMPDDIRQRASDPFFTTKTHGLSTGLGLTMVRSVATNSGGSMSIDSSPGAGTTVVLTLPIATTETVA